MAIRKNSSSKSSRNSRKCKKSRRRNTKSLKKGGGVWDSITNVFGKNESDPTTIDSYTPPLENASTSTIQTPENPRVPLEYVVPPTTTGGRRKRKTRTRKH